MKHTIVAEDGHIAGCYKTISQFFDAFDLPYARDHILKSLLAANSHQLWKGKCPADLIYFYEQFQLLTDAAIDIANCGCVRQAAIIKRQDKKQLPVLTDHGLFCIARHEDKHWLYMPRYLPAAAFFNPYKALRKAVHYITNDVFEELFGTILHHALSFESFTDMSIEWNTLQLNNMLQKLLEAAHLLYVRTAITGNASESREHYYNVSSG